MMASAFLKKDWKVEIVTEPILPARVAHEWMGVSIREFYITGSPRFPYPFVGGIEEYQRFLLSGNWDVIVFQSYSWPLYVALPILDLLKPRKVLVSHGYGALKWNPAREFPYGFFALARSIVQSLYMLTWIKKIHRVVYLSERRDWKAFYDHRLASLITHSGIRVIPNGVDLKVTTVAAESFRERYGVARDNFFFLCVANYSRRKDQGYAARAYRRAAIPNTTLVFIGSDFNEWSEKFQRHDEASLDKSTKGSILWLEKLDRESTLRAFAECDAFVLSADHEAHPIALLEAMREHKPWIARDAGCISEMPGGICVRSEEQMAEAMRKLATEQHLGETLAEDGRRAIESTYNLTSYRTAYTRLIEEFIH